MRIEEPKAQIKQILGLGTSLQLAGAALRPVQHGHHVWFYPEAGIYVAYPAYRGFYRRAFIVMTRSPRYTTSSGIGVGSSLRALHRALSVQCFEYGRGRWILCRRGLTPPGHTGTTFLVNRATRRITQITLEAQPAERPYKP